MKSDFKIFDKMIVGVQVINFEWKFVYLNDEAVIHSGFSRKELIGHTAMELYPGIENTELFSVLRSVMEMGISKTMTNKFIYPDGSIAYFNLYMEPIEEGVLVQSFDITKQKIDEEELRKTNQLLEKKNKIIVEQSETLNNFLAEKNTTIKKMQEEKEFAETLFQYSTEGLLLTDKNGNIIKINSNAEKMFGYEKGELLGKKVDMLIPQYDTDLNGQQKGIVDENLHSQEMGLGINLLVKRKDNSEFAVEVSLSPYEKNNELFIIVFIIDITVRKQNEDDIKRRKKELRETNQLLEKQAESLSRSLEEKNILIREIHHRVKNNLQIIISLLRLQSEQFKDESIKLIIKSFESKISTMALVHHLLYAEGSLVSLDVSDFVTNFCHYIMDMYKIKNVQLETDVDLVDENVNIDTAITFGLLLNEIFTNAIKYGQAEEEPSRILLQLRDDGENNYFLRLEDNGKGIPNEILKTKKSFLGLNLIEDLVDQLEGECITTSDSNGTHYDIKFREINKEKYVVQKRV
ncbi:MAG: PAS domain S-box protein [Bacteroidota bacterium]|nr:PAS domain S-box protein [Bacteroidota bacterium]